MVNVNDDMLIKPSSTVNPSKSSYIATILKGFVIIVDTREQLPYRFSNIPSIRRKLDFADYSVKGFESMVAVERKSVSDFYGSITGDGRPRFKRMLARMNSCEFKGLVIEDSEAVVMTPQLAYSNIHANSTI